MNSPLSETMLIIVYQDILGSIDRVQGRDQWRDSEGGDAPGTQSQHQASHL